MGGKWPRGRNSPKQLDKFAPPHLPPPDETLETYSTLARQRNYPVCDIKRCGMLLSLEEADVRFGSNNGH
jgi:hypothetical protein